MAVRIVRLGTSRGPGEGIRIGIVRRPPRGVSKSQYPTQNWFDIWFPNLAPSAGIVKQGQAVETESEWKAYIRKYRSEMATPDNRHILDLLEVLSHSSDFSVGCYCEDEQRCHRSILRELLIEHGGDVK